MAGYISDGGTASAADKFLNGAGMQATIVGGTPWVGIGGGSRMLTVVLSRRSLDLERQVPAFLRLPMEYREMSKDKKSWEDYLVDSLTKTRDERYAESSKTDKVLYWISIALAALFIVFLLLQR